MSDEAPKIIVDDDWKSQAQAEKQKLAEQAKARQSESAPQLMTKSGDLRNDMVKRPRNFFVFQSPISLNTIRISTRLSQFLMPGMTGAIKMLPHKRRNLHASAPLKPIQCVACRHKGTEIHLHHIIPFADIRGTDEPWNIIPLCPYCHNLTHSGDPLFSITHLFCLKYNFEDKQWRRLLASSRIPLRLKDVEIEAIIRTILKRRNCFEKYSLAIAKKAIEIQDNKKGEIMALRGA